MATVCVALSLPAQAKTCKQPPEAFVQELGNRVIDILGDPGLDDGRRRVVLRDMFLEFVAVDIVGRVLLGRFWPQTTDDQRIAYFDVFPGYISNFYARQVAELPDTSVTVVESSPFGEGDQLVTLNFELADGTVVPAQFRVRCLDGEQKLLDAIVQGVSLLVTKRDEFVSFLRRNDMAALIDFLGRAQ